MQLSQISLQKHLSSQHQKAQSQHTDFTMNTLTLTGHNGTFPNYIDFAVLGT